MNKPEFYDEAPNLNGEYKKLPSGAYVCTIKKALVQKSQKNNDMLVLLLDIIEGEYKDYFKQKFENDNRQDKKWGCVLRMVLDDKSKTEEIRKQMAGRIKGAVTSIENSNKGYKHNWDKPNNEEDLKDKIIGVEFGLEEYVGTDGTTKTIAKASKLRSVDSVRTGLIKEPRVKLLDGSYMDYDDYMEKQEQKNEAESTGEFITIEDTDDLPF